MRAWAGLVLLLGAVVCAASAEGATPKLARPTYHRHAVGRHRAFHLSVEMRDDGKGSTSSYASQGPSERRLKPSIETRINELGAGTVASFGYHPGVVRRTLDPNELNGAAQTRLGHDESSAGVSVKVPL